SQPTVDPGAPTVAVGSPGVSPGTPGAVANPETPVPATPPAPGSTVAKAIVVTGTVVGDANAALTGAPLAGVAPTPGTPTSVPLAGPVAVVLVDAANPGSVAASAIVTAANGNFILTPAPGHTYVMLLRDGSETGRTLAPLFADKQTGRISFSIPVDSADVTLGNITFDSQLGKAWSWSAAALAPPTVAFPFELCEWRGTSDVPTERAPSPLFGAEPFTQKLLLFEEFGPEPMPATAAA